MGGEGLSKVQEWMEKALRAEATLEMVTRERDTAQASLAEGGGKSEPPSTAKRRTTSYDSDEEDDLRVRSHLQNCRICARKRHMRMLLGLMQETVDMLESVINARDAEVLKVTEKLKEFGACVRNPLPLACACGSANWLRLAAGPGQ